MFCQTRSVSNPFVIDRTIISLFDVESQIFVIVATRASLWHISMTPLNCTPTKTHCLVQDSPLYLFYKPSCSQSSVNIHKFSFYHSNKGRSEVNFNDTVKLHDLKNPMSDARFLTVSHKSRVIVPNFLKFLIFGYHGNKGRSVVNFNSTSKIVWPRNTLFGARLWTIYLM